MSQPWTHYFDIAIKVSGLVQDTIEFIMPVWTPGSYLVREFARNVQEFSAVAASGNTLTWEKVNKNTWRVQSGRAPELTVNYRVYAFEMSVRTSFLDDSHGYVNGASVFMYVNGQLGHPYHLMVDPYPGWLRISTGLDPLRDQVNTFLAPDFDTLVDCPIEIGNQQILEFEVRKVPHYIAICGDGNYVAEKLLSDIRKVVEKALEIVNEIPYSHYTFLIHLLSDWGGGLEHMNSTSLQVSRWTFQPEDGYRRFLGLVAHEYFHVWNVKRIRPKELGPFDYTRENYTRMLWVSEGFTSYFGDLMVRRAGLITPDQYLEDLAKTIKGFQETPGRFIESAAQASFDAWIKHYRRDEHSPNATISYYTKGQLIGLVMDLEMRYRTNAARSLDDVMRRLYTRYHHELQRGFTEREFRQACEETAGNSLTEIFEDYANGTKEIDFPRYFGYAGLQFAEINKDKATAKGYLGVSTRTSDGKAIISGVLAGTTGYDSGLNVHDELIAVDGYRVTPDSFTARIEEKSPGTHVEITVARAGRLRNIDALLGKKPAEYKITRVSDPTAEQKKLYESWLLTTWEAPNLDKLEPSRK